MIRQFYLAMEKYDIMRVGNNHSRLKIYMTMQRCCMGVCKFEEGKNRCVILLRASSSGQIGLDTEDELPAQRKLVRKFADDNGLFIVPGSH